jgi:hypothetical protein
MIRWVILFLTISSGALCQQRIEGKVVDRETGKPIPFASVGIEGLPRGTSSNIDGEFSLVVPDTFSIKVTCLGYKSVIIRSTDDFRLIELTPVATQLDEIVILHKEVNPKKIVRKAFSSIRSNYDEQSFLQKFFYRQYSKVDTLYERLIEASVDVWKQRGYRTLRSTAGENEAMRINQLRRSLDIKGMVQGQTPIFIGNILQADIAAYQTPKPGEHLKVFDLVSNLKMDIDRFNFEFKGITTYDGQEVYKINYESRIDSILTSSGYISAPTAKGTLFITTDTYAFVKTEEEREDGINTYRASCYYLKHQKSYYPYHLVREVENHYSNKHYFHVELMAVEISHDDKDQFTGSDLKRTELLNIPYDSSFWNSSTILKTTPLEKDIIRSLGGGNSLNKQFYLYKQYELNVTNGGANGAEKFKWLVEDSKGKRILYVCFWDSNFQSYLIDMEQIKRLNQNYKNKITFVLVSLEEDETAWRQLVARFNYFSDGIINYRIGKSSEFTKSLSVKNAPTFILFSENGDLIDSPRRPSDPLLEEDFKLLMEQGKDQ